VLQVRQCHVGPRVYLPFSTNLLRVRGLMCVSMCCGSPELMVTPVYSTKALDEATQHGPEAEGPLLDAMVNKVRHHDCKHILRWWALATLGKTAVRGLWDVYVTFTHSCTRPIGRTPQGANASSLSRSFVMQVCSFLPRLHVLVVGPGLGRHGLVLGAVGRVLTEARNKDVPIGASHVLYTSTE
jgi:hypothetical protein